MQRPHIVPVHAEDQVILLKIRHLYLPANLTGKLNAPSSGDPDGHGVGRFAHMGRRYARRGASGLFSIQQALGMVVKKTFCQG